jgi:hypothetical protein
MLSPEDFVLRYHNLQVNTLMPFFDPPICCAENKTFAIVRYVSGLTTYTNNVRGRIRKFLNKQGENPESGIFKVGDNIWTLPYLQIEPIYDFSDDALTRVLSGRGSIWEIQSTMRIASLMMATYDTKKDFYGAIDLKTFVDYFLGMDCNGFAGAYLRAFGANPGTGNQSCKTLASGPKRQKASEVRERDFIYHDDSPDHIQVIGKVEKCEGDWVYCNISEARSYALKGAQTNPWKIKRDGAGWKMIRTDVGGAATHRTWISRNPMVG